MSKIKIDLPMKEIEEFCKKWKVQEFALFGSVLRDDFDPKKSDVDVLITFANRASTSLFDLVDMHDELGRVFNRKIDLVDKQVIEEDRNPYRKKAILEHYEVIYGKAA
jgi:uncharacterized protein